MDKLMDFYRSVQNPLDDLDKLKTIIKVYSDSKKNNKRFYSTILDLNSINKQNSGTYNPYIEEVIDYWKFVSWKDNIIHMTPEKYAKFYGSEKGFYSNDFVKLQMYLKQIDRTVSKENFEKIKQKMMDDDSIKNAYEKYDYEIFQSGWSYVSSTNLFKSEPIKVQHRFYINCDSVSKYNVIIKIIDNFNENNIPIFFKYNDADRDDTIVLWTDNENLLSTVNMLKSIKEKIPDDTCFEPTILAGTIDGWLGYGSEPTSLLNGEQTSYNKVRTTVIKSAIENAYAQYISSHINAKGLSEYEIAERDPRFIQSIRVKIIIYGKEYGIDENNFCFDTKTVQQMKQMDNPISNTSLETEEPDLEALLRELYEMEEKYKEREDEDNKYGIDESNFCFETKKVQLTNQMDSSVSDTSLEIEEEPDLEALLRELYQMEEKYKKRENPDNKKYIKHDKKYYKNAESYLRGLINLTPEQRKRGNQYLSTLEQDKNLHRGDN